MITKTFKVKASTFRKLDDPFENGASKKYVFYVKVDDVPEGIPMATNPRDQKLTSSVARAIEESLLSNDGYFHLKKTEVSYYPLANAYSAMGTKKLLFRLKTPLSMEILTAGTPIRLYVSTRARTLTNMCSSR